MAYTTLILGASRGIGLELARQSLAAGERVIATARDDAGLERLRALGCQPLRLDVTDPASTSGLAWQLDGEKPDLALYVAGVMRRPGARTRPRARTSTPSCTPTCWAPCRSFRRWRRWWRPRAACLPSCPRPCR